MGDVDPVEDDEPSIPADAELWRRIPWLHWVADSGVPDGRRVSSAAFDDPEMSVVIADECEGGEAALLRGHPGFGIASFTVGDVRGLGWGVVRAPDENLPGHAHVTGRKSRSKLRQLAKLCHIRRAPTLERDQ